MASDSSITVLSQVAAKMVAHFSITEQITIYQALGETLPTAQERAAALELSRVLSRAAALQLEFSELLKEGSR